MLTRRGLCAGTFSLLMLTPLGNKESDRHSRSRVAVKNLMMPGTPSQFLKFAMAGAAGTICHYATLLLWVEVLALPVVAGALAGFCVGALTNYLLARRFVFASGRPHASALPRFAAVATAGAAVNTGIVALLYGAGTHYVLAQVVATVAVLAWNFLANRFWTFAD